MAMQTIPVWPSMAQAPGLMVRQLWNLSATLAGRMHRRWNHADARQLMRMEPYMLRDIGVIPAGPQDTAAAPRWRPAAPAANTQRDAQSETAGI